MCLDMSHSWSLFYSHSLVGATLDGLLATYGPCMVFKVSDLKDYGSIYQHPAELQQFQTCLLGKGFRSFLSMQ